MGKQASFRDLITLITAGCGVSMVSFVVLAAASVLIGLLVSAFFEVEWDVTAILAFVLIRFGIASVELVIDSRPSRCPDCGQKLKKGKSRMCRDCSGVAMLKLAEDREDT